MPLSILNYTCLIEIQWMYQMYQDVISLISLLHMKTYVVKVWWKVCAEHKSSLNVQLRGSATTSTLAFIDGTNSVTWNEVS